MGVSKNRGTPKSSILIGISLIFTIHFGVALFLETPIFESTQCKVKSWKDLISTENCYHPGKFHPGKSLFESMIFLFSRWDMFSRSRKKGI